MHAIGGEAGGVVFASITNGANHIDDGGARTFATEIGAMAGNPAG